MATLVGQVQKKCIGSKVTIQINCLANSWKESRKVDIVYIHAGIKNMENKIIKLKT